MTRFLKDIYNQPGELAKTLAYTLGPGRESLEKAAELVKSARNLYITGIGSSWHAGMAIVTVFSEAARPVMLWDASELLHCAEIAPDSTTVILSRSGKSVEIVGLLAKCRKAGAKIVAITNTPDSPLALEADVVLKLEAAFDHNVSVTMYTGLALVGSLMACAVNGALSGSLCDLLSSALNALASCLDPWRAKIQASDWFAADAPAYFLARGASLATAHETELLWEEATKSPATALTTGDFRHGPQEIVREGLRFCIWIDPRRQRAQDLILAADLRRNGCKVMLIGQSIPERAGDLVFPLPGPPALWQFLIDIVPTQLAAEHLSHLRGVDCDSFNYCPYIIESEGGLAG
ncbi:MAG: SIS domain-containing protein [Armatimonadetes bacterium]|nr:SIS domain-containing protein [Armatimonadota bacterium]